LDDISDDEIEAQKLTLIRRTETLGVWESSGLRFEHIGWKWRDGAWRYTLKVSRRQGLEERAN